MCWLLYVGGGYLFILFGIKAIGRPGKASTPDLVDFIALFSVWTWLCLRFL